MNANVAAPNRLQRDRVAGWLRAHTGWTINRPWLVIVLLAAVGIALRHAWISTQPLAAGDWHWPDVPRLLNWSPWPSVWDNTLGLGGENRFVEAFRFDLYAVIGGIAHLGATWTFIEKAVYFIPEAVLLPVAGWLLAREIMGRSRWTLLTPLLLVGNTYFLLEADGEVPLVLAEAISFLMLVAFLRTMRTGSPRWAIVTGLLMAVTAAFDVRPVYLSALLMIMYFVIVALFERDLRLLIRRTALGVVAGAVFVGSQAFWLIPLLTYHGNAGFPTPQQPNFDIITLSHGLDGVSSFWTGGSPSLLVQAPLNPAYSILPLIALTPLLARRIRPEVLWLAIAALLFAFFAKTNTPPLGEVYDWMYLHVPGWKLFREGSKFLYIVGLAYAILIPVAFSAAVDLAGSMHRRVRRVALRAGTGAALAGVVVLSSASLVVLQTGALASTTVPTQEPPSFAAMSTLLSSDARPGAVLWFGQPLVVINNRAHRFLIATPAHPAVDLTGNFNNTQINSRDPLQLFCANDHVAFCYANAQLLPYLTQITGTGYVVVPGGSAVGTLPRGVTRSWLRSQVTAALGSPTSILGSGATQLIVWRVASPQPVVASFPAVALVDSGSWSTLASLPALEATGLPAAYRQSFDTLHYPIAPADLPDSVRVLPRVDGGCLGSSAGAVVVMAETIGATLDADVSGSARVLPQVASAPRLPGWSAYGPFNVAAGGTPISTVSGGATLGPCIAWSPLAAASLGSHPSSIVTTTQSAQGERITSQVSGAVGGAWVELLRYQDPGWRLGSEKPTVLGNGLFNLYHLDATHEVATKLTFSFSTINWELLGRGISGIVLIVTVGVGLWDWRRRRFDAPAFAAYRLRVFRVPLLARWMAGVGMALLAATAVVVTLEWFGVPSLVPWLTWASDPYNVDVGYGAGAIGLLILAAVVVVVTHVLGRRPHAVAKPADVPLRGGAALAAVVVLGLLVAACAQSPANLQSLITQAQDAGALAPTISGDTLDDARLQRVARNAQACIADYTQVLRQVPQLISAYVGRAQCYLNGGDNGAAAVHDFTEAIALAPLQSDLYLGRAVAYRVVGNLTAATVDYTTAAFSPSAGAGEQLTAINGLVVVGDVPEAMTVYQRALALDPQSMSLRLAGASIALASNNESLADADLDAAIQRATSSSQMAQVLSQECHLDVQRQNYAVAITVCTQASQAASPGGSGALDDLSAAELGVGNPAAAYADISASINVFVANVGPYAQEGGVDGFGLANLYVARGWIDIQMQQSQAAVADFRTALTSLPGPSPDARARIKGNIATAMGDG